VASPIFHVARTTTPATIFKIANDVGAARQFTLNALPTFSDFVNVFQYYRIDAVEVQYNLITPNVSGTQPFPRLYTAIDYQVFGTPATVDVLTSYTNLEQYQFGTSKTTYVRKFKPKMGLTAGGANNALLMSGWVSLGTPGVSHWGLAEFLAPYNTTVNNNFTVEFTVRYFLSFKGGR